MRWSRLTKEVLSLRILFDRSHFTKVLSGELGLSETGFDKSILVVFPLKLRIDKIFSVCL